MDDWIVQYPRITVIDLAARAKATRPVIIPRPGEFVFIGR